MQGHYPYRIPKNLLFDNGVRFQKIKEIYEIVVLQYSCKKNIESKHEKPSHYIGTDV